MKTTFFFAALAVTAATAQDAARLRGAAGVGDVVDLVATGGWFLPSGGDGCVLSGGVDGACSGTPAGNWEDDSYTTIEDCCAAKMSWAITMCIVQAGCGSVPRTCTTILNEDGVEKVRNGNCGMCNSPLQTSQWPCGQGKVCDTAPCGPADGLCDCTGPAPPLATLVAVEE